MHHVSSNCNSLEMDVYLILQFLLPSDFEIRFYCRKVSFSFALFSSFLSTANDTHFKSTYWQTGTQTNNFSGSNRDGTMDKNVIN